MAPERLAIPPACAAAGGGGGGYTGRGGSEGTCGRVTVCVEIENAAAAAHATEEVVQVYAIPRAVRGGASVPNQMLLAFRRTAAALQPGDAETVCLPIDLADLRLMGATEHSGSPLVALRLYGDRAETGWGY